MRHIYLSRGGVKRRKWRTFIRGVARGGGRENIFLFYSRQSANGSVSDGLETVSLRQILFLCDPGGVKGIGAKKGLSYLREKIGCGVI